MELFARIGGKTFMLMELDGWCDKCQDVCLGDGCDVEDCPLACGDDEFELALDELEDTTKLNFYDLPSPPPKSPLSWCKEGMRVQVCPADGPSWRGRVEHEVESLGWMAVTDEVTNELRLVKETTPVFMLPEEPDKPYGVTPPQPAQVSESLHAHTT